MSWKRVSSLLELRYVDDLSDVAWISLAYFEMRSILTRMLWNFDMQMDEVSQGWLTQKEYTFWDKPSLWVKLEHRALTDG